MIKGEIQYYNELLNLESKQLIEPNCNSYFLFDLDEDGTKEYLFKSQFFNKYYLYSNNFKESNLIDIESPKNSGKIYCGKVTFDDNSKGFFIDKDDQSKGRFQGQIGRVKYSQYAFEDKTLPSGIVINRDQNILRSLAAIAKSLGLSEQLDSITADTIEDFVAKAKVILTDSEAGYLYLCLGGRAYTDKNGYTKYDLHLVKSKNKLTCSSPKEAQCTNTL